MTKTVFITWSGKETRPIANILNTILSVRFNHKNINFFYSVQEIKNGEIWINSIMKNLDKCCFGIVCLSPHNANSPWLNFETGAIIKGFQDTSKIFIFNTEKINPKNIVSPLNMFQINNKSLNDKIEELYHKMNDLLDEVDKYTPSAIKSMSKDDTSFYIEESNKILNNEVDLFISFPIQGLQNREKELSIVESVVRKLEANNIKVFCSAVNGKKINGSTIAMERINLIKNCKAYVIIHPEKTMSFTLVECGIALGLNKPSLIIGKNNDDSFPSVLLEMSKAGANLECKNCAIQSYTSNEDLFESVKSFAVDYI